jgi:hypothetical protein
MHWAQVAAKAAMQGFTADGQGTVYLKDTIYSKLLLPQIAIINQTPSPETCGQRQANAMLICATAATHAAWVRFGRQIFELSPGLVEAFRLTDVKNASFEGLHLPYRSFFLHFGLQPDLVFDDSSRLSPEYVDGAYILQTGAGTITVELTLTRPAGEVASHLPGLHISIDPVLARLGAEDAMNQAIDNSLSMGYGNIPQLDPMYEAEALRLQEAARSVLTKAASLISNALFYLSEPQDDLTLKYEEGAPPALVKRALQGKPGQQQQAKQALNTEGYAFVRYCGAHFSRHGANDGSSSELTKAHWRRGHWRNQPHGPQLTLIKRVWIRPVLVKAEANTSDVGRVYTVDPHCSSTLELR